MTAKRHIVMYSGGIGSWGAAQRVCKQYGPSNVTLLFSDTLVEDTDLYRFLDESATALGAQLERIVEGRTPWQVFKDRRLIGSARIAPCSHILKQQPARKWLLDHFPDPASCTLYVGIDWTEEHRLAGIVRHWLPYHVAAPMCESPLLIKSELLSMLRANSIEPPRLYAEGFPHNNCDGFCVRMGRAGFAYLLEKRPNVYLENELQEEETRTLLGKNVSIMRDRDGSPLTMRQYRQYLEASHGQVDDDAEIGGCGCFTDDDESLFT